MASHAMFFVLVTAFIVSIAVYVGSLLYVFEKRYSYVFKIKSLGKRMFFSSDYVMANSPGFQ